MRSKQIKAQADAEDAQGSMRARERRAEVAERELQEMRAAVEALKEEKRKLIVKWRRAAAAVEAAAEREENGVHARAEQQPPRPSAAETVTVAAAGLPADEADIPACPPEAHRRLLASIHERVDALLVERAALQEEAAATAAVASAAAAERDELRARLDAQTRQMELAVSREALLAARGAGGAAANGNGQVAFPKPSESDAQDEYFVDRALSLLVSIFVGAPKRQVSTLSE